MAGMVDERLSVSQPRPTLDVDVPRGGLNPLDRAQTVNNGRHSMLGTSSGDASSELVLPSDASAGACGRGVA